MYSMRLEFCNCNILGFGSIVVVVVVYNFQIFREEEEGIFRENVCRYFRDFGILIRFFGKKIHFEIHILFKF